MSEGWTGECLETNLCEFHNLSRLTSAQPLSCRDAYGITCAKFYGHCLVEDMCKANACFRMERLGDCSIESATAVTFSCAVLVLGRPDLLLFNADDVCRKLETQRCIVFPVGTGS